MKRTFFASALCCLLAVLLPMSAMADHPDVAMLDNAYQSGKALEIAVAVEPGEELSADQAVLDLLRSLQLRFAAQKGAGCALTIGADKLDSNGLPTGTYTDVLALALRGTEDGLYIGADLLGDKPIYLSNEDLLTVLGSLAEQCGVSLHLPADLTAVVPAETESADQRSSSEQLADLLSGKDSAAAPAQEPTDEALRARLLSIFGGDEGLTDYMLSVKARAVITDVDMQADDHDAAVQKTEVTLTQEDLITILGSDYCREQIVNGYRQQGESNPEQTADEYIAQRQAIWARSTIEIPIVVLRDADGGVVCFDCMATGHIARSDSDDTEYYDITMPLRYARKTTADGKSYAFSMYGNNVKDGKEDPQVYAVCKLFHGNDASLEGALSLGEYNDGVEAAQLEASLTYAWSGNEAAGDLRILSDGKTALLHIDQTLGEASLDNTLVLTVGKTDAFADAKPLLTLHADVAVTDAHATIGTLQSVTPEASVQIGKMSSDELTEYANSLSVNAITFASTLISALPSSLGDYLTNLLINMYTGGM